MDGAMSEKDAAFHVKLRNMTREDAIAHLKTRGLLPTVLGIHVKRACRQIGSEHLQTEKYRSTVRSMSVSANG